MCKLQTGGSGRRQKNSERETQGILRQVSISCCRKEGRNLREPENEEAPQFVPVSYFRTKGCELLETGRAVDALLNVLSPMWVPHCLFHIVQTLTSSHPTPKLLNALSKRVVLDPQVGPGLAEG